jgi:hypothetical protein
LRVRERGPACVHAGVRFAEGGEVGQDCSIYLKVRGMEE